MLKRILLVVALVALLTSTSFAKHPEQWLPNFLLVTGEKIGILATAAEVGPGGTATLVLADGRIAYVSGPYICVQLKGGDYQSMGNALGAQKILTVPQVREYGARNDRGGDQAMEVLGGILGGLR